MNKYWSEKVRNLVPYVPGEQPKDKKYIKLNTNENPYPPSPKALQAMQAAACADMRLYPDPEFTGLRKTIAELFGVEPEWVYAGNGSDELLAFCFMAFFDPGRRILFPDVTYSFYPVYAKIFNIDYKEVPLDSGFGIRPGDYSQPNGGIIFPNPNAPTGKYLGLLGIEEILASNKESVVVIDEAYIDFGGESAVGLVKKYPNLLIVRTLSKSHSLAGLRAGYIVGDPELVEAVIRIKNSFNSYTMDRIALAGAEAALHDTDYFIATRSKIADTRERTARQLKELGFMVVDSNANFLFISHPKVTAPDIFNRLRERGILVRHFNKPRIDNFLRVTIGTDEDMDCMMSALKGIIGQTGI